MELQPDYRPLDETQQSWPLCPDEQKKYVDCWVSFSSWIIGGFKGIVDEI